jgi:hypothetical protein
MCLESNAFTKLAEVADEVNEVEDDFVVHQPGPVHVRKEWQDEKLEQEEDDFAVCMNSSEIC